MSAPLIDSATASRTELPAQALALWRRLLGPECVLTDQPTLNRYGRTTLRGAPATRAVIRPHRADQIPGLLHIARTYCIPLYPISRGRNWGWGDACPVTGGQAILDLGGLDRILEINAELGYAVVEPGVTQGQLAEALAAEAPEWWLESTNAGPETSILGNTLERGLGMGDRTASVCGLEAVLPDGQLLRTGFGNFPHSRVTHLAKWGIGPNLEGLLSQSNLGVVTRMGIWLMPRPQGAECCLVSVPAGALTRLIDALRPLRMRGVLTTNVHIFPVSGHDRQPRWLAVGALYGADVLRAAYRSEIEQAVAGLGHSHYFEGEPHDAEEVLGALSIQAVPGIEDLFQAGAALCTGKPFSATPDFLLSYLGGDRAQQSPRTPKSADPLENNYGFYFLWSTCPATGRDLQEGIDLVTASCGEHGFRPQLTIQMPSGRAAVLVIRICFNRQDREARVRASRCYKAALHATVDAGFPPWRLGIEGMALLKQPGIDMTFVRRLKAWMDSASVLAPGRYVW
jgi:4-cresol dehydrogenase (hydroxylating)